MTPLPFGAPTRMDPVANLLGTLVDLVLKGIGLLIDLGGAAVDSPRRRLWVPIWCGVVGGIAALLFAPFPLGWLAFAASVGLGVVLGRAWQRRHDERPPDARSTAAVLTDGDDDAPNTGPPYA